MTQSECSQFAEGDNSKLMHEKLVYVLPMVKINDRSKVTANKNNIRSILI